MGRIGMIILFILGTVVLVAGVVAGSAYWSYRQWMDEAEAAWQSIAAAAVPTAAVYDPAMVAGLPEIAQRYFNHAIAPGTLLSTTVELTMSGTFRLGDKDKPQTFEMTARQILAPPDAFVWLPEMRSGPMIITGSDGLAAQGAWTRFWILGLIPVVQSAASEGLDRSAKARPALEAIWAPASFLPANGASWEQTGPDAARVTFGSGPEAIGVELVLEANGAMRSVSTLRWSDANPAHQFQLQPFGGTVSGEAQFGGYTIPSVVDVGNFYGTPDYFPFFSATITGAAYR